MLCGQSTNDTCICIYVHALHTCPYLHVHILSPTPSLYLHSSHLPHADASHTAKREHPHPNDCIKVNPEWCSCFNIPGLMGVIRLLLHCSLHMVGFLEAGEARYSGYLMDVVLETYIDTICVTPISEIYMYRPCNNKCGEQCGWTTGAFSSFCVIMCHKVFWLERGGGGDKSTKYQVCQYNAKRMVALTWNARPKH